MLAYAQKENLGTFSVTTGSYLDNSSISPQIVAAFQNLAQKCYEGQTQNTTVLRLEEGDKSSLNDFLQFDLFSEGPVDNSVILPHPVFQDYIAATHLANHSQTWEAVFRGIKTRNLDPLHNVIRFLVGLSSTVAKQVSTLFTINEIVCIDQCVQPLLQYEIDLIRECKDDTRLPLVKALANAPVETSYAVSMDAENYGSYELLAHQTAEEQVSFLKKVYRIKFSAKGETTTSPPTITNDSVYERNVVWDSYVLAFVKLKNCLIQMDNLNIGTESHLPVGMLSENMRGVRNLKVMGCTLCEKTPNYMSELSFQNKLAVSHGLHGESSLENVTLERVKGLHLMGKFGAVSPRKCKLALLWCDKVTLGTLRSTFPKLYELTLLKTTIEYNTQLITLRKLTLFECDDLELFQMLFCFVHLKTLTAKKCILKLSIDTEKENSTLIELSLDDCKDISLAQILQECGQFVQLKSIILGKCKLRLFDICYPQKGRKLLDELVLVDCEEDVDLPVLFQKCSEYLGFKSLGVAQCKLKLLDGGIQGDVRNDTLEELGISDCEEDIDLALVFEACRRCVELKLLTVENCTLQFVHKSVRLNMTLRELSLNACKHDVDLTMLLHTCTQYARLELLTLEECKLQRAGSSTTDCYIKQNHTLRELALINIEGEVQLSDISHTFCECLQLKSMTVDGCDISLDGSDYAKEMPMIQVFTLSNSSVLSVAGLTLNDEQARRSLSRLCPNAAIYIDGVSYARSTMRK